MCVVTINGSNKQNQILYTADSEVLFRHTHTTAAAAASLYVCYVSQSILMFEQNYSHKIVAQNHLMYTLL